MAEAERLADPKPALEEQPGAVLKRWAWERWRLAPAVLLMCGGCGITQGAPGQPLPSASLWEVAASGKISRCPSATSCPVLRNTTATRESHPQGGTGLII